MLHYLTFLSFAGATAHGLLSGTDAASWGRWVYLSATVPVVFLFVYRIVLAIGRPRRTTRSRAVLWTDGARSPGRWRRPDPSSGCLARMALRVRSDGPRTGNRTDPPRHLGRPSS